MLLACIDGGVFCVPVALAFFSALLALIGCVKGCDHAHE